MGTDLRDELGKVAQNVRSLAAALKAAEAKVADLRSIANVNGDWTVKYSDAISRAEKAEADLTAARAEIERYRAMFDMAGNYIPHSQIDGDLRAARAEIERLAAGILDIQSAANSFCDESGDEVAGQVRLRCRAILGEQGK